MSNVHLPIHVVALFRRLVDVISAFSISTQYLPLVKPGVEQQRSSETSTVESDSPGTLQALKTVEWPWWTFPGSWRWEQLSLLRASSTSEPANSTSSSVQSVSTLHSTPGTTLPWFGRSWSWPSFTSILANGRASSGHAEQPPSPPSQEKRPKGRKSSSRKASQLHPRPRSSSPADIIHHLLRNPALFDPIRTPRYPIVLCHGLYGFDVRGPASFPSLRMHYWSNVLSILKDKVGAEVLVTSVPATGSIASRSHTLHQQLQDRMPGRGINFIAHSMGGLDCRHLISHIKPTQYATNSLTTISTPHQGSPFMDWCVDHIGIGRSRGQAPATLREPTPSDRHSIPESVPRSPVTATPFPLSLSSFPSSFTTLLLSIVDSPAYANLTTTYLTRVFNPLTPDDPRVRYFSVAGRLDSVPVWHPLWLPKMVLDGVEAREREKLCEEWDGSGEKDVPAGHVPPWQQEDKWGNDGLVTVQSARWGEFLGTLEGCDHWAMRGARGIELGVDLKPGHVMDGWTLPDWGRLVGWKKEERVSEGVGVGVEEGKRKQRLRVNTKEEERADEALIKSSADKLSAVVDWLVEQVPAPRFSSKAKVDGETESAAKLEGGRKDLETKMDLERFYVALSRKLYDEGL